MPQICKKIIPFYLNDNPDAPDGNYSRTFKNLQPFINSLQKPMYKPKNFSIKELVSPEIYIKYGEKAWEFFDERILKNYQFLRDNLGVIKVNNGTTFKYRGFDACEFRKNGVSQHNHGRAIDGDVVGKSAKEVRDWIIQNQDRLPEPNCWIEDNVSWLHMDVRYSNKKGVYLFSELD